jgi:hypothetical protein
MTRVFPAAALLALGACNGSFDQRVHEDVHQTIAAAPAAPIHVENVAGSVRVVGWSKAAVDIQATKYGYDEQALRAVTIGVRKEGDAIFIQTSYGGGTHSGGVRYRLSVPTGASLDISNIAGAVDINGVSGDVRVETQAGEITADAGRVAGNRSIDLQATTGAIKLSIAPGSSATVDGSSTVGAFASDIPGISTSRENIVGMRASGRIGSGSAHIAITTTTGAIALRER